MVSLLLMLVPLTTCVTNERPHIVSSSEMGSAPAEARAINHYLASRVYQRQRDLEQAIAEMRKASDLAPDNVDITRRLIGAYDRAGDYENARTMCERAVEQNPNDEELWTLLGGVYQRLDLHEEAVQAYWKALDLNPESEEARVGLVIAKEATNDLIDVIDLYRELIAGTSKKNAELYYQLGRSLYLGNDTGGAQEALETAVEVDPRHMSARYLLGVVYMDREQLRDAQRAFTTVYQRDPDHMSTRDNLSSVLARQGNYALALDLMTEQTLSGRSTAAHHMQRLYLLLRAGELEEASRTVPPNGAPIMGTVLRAIVRMQTDMPYQALVASLDGIEGNLDVEVRGILNQLLFLYGKQDAGPFLLEALQGLRDQNAPSRVLETLIGRTLIGMERLDDAERVLLEAVEHHESDKLLHYYLATVYEEQDQFESAVKHLSACLEADPDDADVMNFLAYLYAEEGVNLDEAEALLTRALAQEPDSGFFLDSLGWVHYRRGDADLAIDYIRKAILAMSTDDAVLRDHLGDAYFLKGDRESAVKEWERARRLDAELGGVQEKIDRARQELGQ
jgi:tetratricopeptide (TPR) repeat protein